MNMRMLDESRKLDALGLKPETLSAYKVLCLPENIFSSGTPIELLEPSDSIDLGKLLKEAGITCGTARDLGLQTKILERRANDKWLGVVWIRDNVATGLVVGVISSLIAATIYSKITAPVGKPQPQIHLDLYIERTNSVSKISYNGDGETLVKVLKSLEEH
jgi:hypothetical protein